MKNTLIALTLAALALSRPAAQQPEAKKWDVNVEFGPAQKIAFDTSERDRQSSDRTWLGAACGKPHGAPWLPAAKRDGRSQINRMG